MYFVAYRTDDKRREGDERKDVEGRRRQRLYYELQYCNNSYTI